MKKRYFLTVMETMILSHMTLKEFESGEIPPALAQPETSSIRSLPSCSSDEAEEVEVVVCSHLCYSTTSETSQPSAPNISARSERIAVYGKTFIEDALCHLGIKATHGFMCAALL